MKRYSFKRFSLKAIFAFCAVFLVSFSSPSLAVGYNPSDSSQITTLTGLDVPASADIRMIFNNASLHDKMVGDSADSDSFTNQVITTKGKIPDSAPAKKSSSSSIKKQSDDLTIQKGAILAVPEPATILILGLGSIVIIRKRKT